MTTRAETLASGPGWSIGNILCSAGPHDRPFEEQHPSVCIAAVMQGSFQYRTTQGAATLVPGALLLGNHQSCFECGHDHAAGDRCLSFMFDPAYFEAILSAVPGVRNHAFQVPRLPPLMALTRFFAAAQLASSGHDPVWFEQLALDLASSTVVLVTESAGTEPAPSRRDERRIAIALRRIEDNFNDKLSIADLAKDAAMSPFHFLRVFRRVTGMTPHRFILRTRLQNAALQLRRSGQPVLDIALDAGFADLSTFNRQFRSIMGTTPSGYRGCAVLPAGGLAEPPPPGASSVSPGAPTGK